MRIIFTLLALAVFAAALGFAGVMGLYAYYARDLPDPGALANRSLFQTARILDRNGKLLEELVDPEGGRRTLVTLDKVPVVMRDATIAAEDSSFYDNPGFDARAIVRAFYQWARYGSPQSGASTITQQLVKNTLLGPEQTGERKAKEAFLAIELTRRYSKDQILQMYLNEINYGNRAYGIEAAAETYFGKPAQGLTLAEASLLAGLPQAPAYYDPYENLPAAQERQRYVLEQMVRTRAITQAQAEQALAAPPSLKPRSVGRSTQAPHFVSYVRQQVEEQFGTEALFRSGLQITTTLDLDWQNAATRVARERIQAVKGRNANNAAVVSIKPETGEILAMLGSVNFDDPSIDGQVNVALAERQPGSALKPFTYLTAFGKGWSPATVLMDLPTDFNGYRPNNFDDRFRGPVSVRSALAQSLNIPAVEALQFVGIPDMLATVHRLGVTSLRQPERYGLSVTLGGGEVRLLDLTYAYAALANGGRQVGTPAPTERRQGGFRAMDPVSILKVTDSGGKVLYQYQPPQPLEVADPRLVYQVTSVLSDNAARLPTYGANNALELNGRPAAVKTGTTNNYVDAWTVGYTPDLVTGVWVGNTRGGAMQEVGGSLGAGAIWNGFMEEVLRGTPVKQFQRPSGVVEAEVCALSTLLPTQECRDAQTPVRGTVKDLFVESVNLPTKPDTWYQRVEVCVVNGKRVTPLVPANGREQRVFVQLPEPYRTWGEANGYPAPPTEACDDVYKGERRAEIDGPRPADRLVAGGDLQVVGSVWIDDFAEYSLDIGPGAAPSAWTVLTDRRTQAVDKALLGIWPTANLQPGPYTLRLRVSDSLGNVVEGQQTVTLVAPPTPTPAPTASPVPTAVAPPTATPVPAAAATPTRPAAQPPATPPGPTPTPAATPRPTVPPKPSG